MHKRNFLFDVLFYNIGFEKQKSIWCILNQLFVINKIVTDLSTKTGTVVITSCNAETSSTCGCW